jgi:hypothetical protein
MNLVSLLSYISCISLTVNPLFQILTSSISPLKNLSNSKEFAPILNFCYLVALDCLLTCIIPICWSSMYILNNDEL